MRVLIDAGMGAVHLAPVKQMGVDLLILSHSHIDHHLTKRDLAGVPIWCHRDEAPYTGDKEVYLEATGIRRSGVDISFLLDGAPTVFDYEIQQTLVDGQVIDLGGLSLEVLHTPGHTPGHMAFYLREHDFLFLGDVDLTRFGPYYGHDFADLGDFIASIRRLKALGAASAASGHAGPFAGDLDKRFVAYEEVIYQRDARVLAHLSQPRTLGEFKRGGVIYNKYFDDFGLQDFFELVHVEKHLERLVQRGLVGQEGERWRRLD